MRCIHLFTPLMGLLGSCTFSPDGPDMSPTDGSSSECAWSHEPAHFDPCTLDEPRGALVLALTGTYRYDTMTGSLVEPDRETKVAHASKLLKRDDQDVRIASLSSLEIRAGAILRVVGPVPLIIASEGDILIAGELNASSNRTGENGAGANPAACSSGQGTQGTDDMGGGAGGGGGGFGGKGGNGSNGDTDQGQSNGGPGGPALASLPGFVRGGCAGARGGNGNGNTGGAGGAGGGAIELASQTTIRVEGTIQAGGAGGGGGISGGDGGGGGGGSGGFIGLDATTVVVSGTLAANGGGGGEGSNVGQGGTAGGDGLPSAAAAAGGDGGADAAVAGGNGSSGSSRNGQPAVGVDVAGGGGGGGSSGFIVVSTANILSGSVLSPPAETL